MKKRMMIGVLAAVTVLTTGCGTDVPELSKTDNAKAAEYIAGEALKRDTNYEYGFSYDRSVLDPTPVPTEAPKQAEATAAADDTQSSGSSKSGETASVQTVSLSQIYDQDGVSVNQTSYHVKKTYGTGYESIKPSSGKKLVILYFKVKNSTNATKTVNLMTDKPDYRLQIGDDQIAPMYSIAEGDMQFFQEKIAAGKSKQGVLIFEVPTKAKLDQAELYIAKGTKQATITLR